MPRDGPGHSPGLGHGKAVRRPLSLRYYLRQSASLLFAGTLATEYFRSTSSTQTFPFWCTALHFVYFQLPQRSRALIWFHPLSYIAAVAAPVRYLFLLFSKPGLERDRAELLELPLPSVLARALVLHLAPLLLHALDIGTSQHSLLTGYASKPKKLILAWSLLSYPLFGWAFELVFPPGEDSGLGGSSGDVLSLERLGPELEQAARVSGIAAMAFAWLLLYLRASRD